MTVETQTAYLLALAFDLLPEDARDRAAERLVDDIRALDWHLSTGFVGIGHLNPQLTLAGLWLLNQGGAALPLLGLPAVQQPFDMITMLGFLILMGTVVNNPILIVDRAIRFSEEQAVSPLDAVREAVGSRLRPIAMSTLTTVCGLSPLVFVPGAGTELYRGVGAVVGVSMSSIESLSLVPWPAASTPSSRMAGTAARPQAADTSHCRRDRSGESLSPSAEGSVR